VKINNIMKKKDWTEKEKESFAIDGCVPDRFMEEVYGTDKQAEKIRKARRKDRFG